MTRISRFELGEKTLNRLFDLLFSVVGNKKDIDEFKKTIVDLLSPTERIMIAKRVAIIYLLLKKMEYEEIAHILKVSTSTIAKFHLIMEKSDGIVPTFNKLQRNEKIGQFLEEIYLIFRGSGTKGVNWSIANKKQNELNKRKHGLGS